MKMKWTRRICAMMVLCMVLALLGGCQKDDGHGLDPKNPTTITIWHYYNGLQQEQFDNLLVDFNQTVGHEMGIIVQAHNKNSISDLDASALSALRGDPGAEEAPDMFTAYSATAYTADQLDGVADLTPYFTEEELGEYVQEYLEEGNLDDQGGLKIFPVAKSTEVMMLNVTDWEPFAQAEGVSTDDLTTWEGLARVAALYYDYTDGLTPDEPNDGKSFFGRDSIANYMIVGGKQLGMEFAKMSDGELVLDVDKDGVKRLWEGYFVPYVQEHYLSRGRYRSDDAQVGDIICMVCSTPGSTYFPKVVTLDDEHVYPVEGLVMPVPNFEGTDPYVVQQGAGMVVVKSDEAREYACSVFLKWFTEQDRSIAFSVNSGYLPVKTAANDIEAIAAGYEAAGNPANDTLMDVMKVAAQEIADYELYTSKPYDSAESVRSFLESYIQDTAQQAHDDAAERIASGEDRADVFPDYISDEAFETWYEGFLSGLQAAAGI